MPKCEKAVALTERISLDEFVATHPQIMPIIPDRNIKISLYDGDKKLLEERMLYPDSAFEL